MSKEALRDMYQLLLTEPHAPTVCAKLERIVRDALARPEQPDYKTLAIQLQQERKQEQGEPVAWMDEDGDVLSASVVNGTGLRNIPLYTTQQRTWVGLSDEEAQWLYDNCRTPANLIDMTEAKLKDKNDPNGT